MNPSPMMGRRRLQPDSGTAPSSALPLLDHLCPDCRSMKSCWLRLGRLSRSCFCRGRWGRRKKRGIAPPKPEPTPRLNASPNRCTLTDLEKLPPLPSREKSRYHRPEAAAEELIRRRGRAAAASDRSQTSRLRAQEARNHPATCSRPADERSASDCESRTLEDSNRPSRAVRSWLMHVPRPSGELKQSDPEAYQKAVKQLQKGFVADAVMGNWDVIVPRPTTSWSSLTALSCGSTTAVRCGTGSRGP